MPRPNVDSINTRALSSRLENVCTDIEALIRLSFLLKKSSVLSIDKSNNHFCVDLDTSSTREKINRILENNQNNFNALKIEVSKSISRLLFYKNRNVEGLSLRLIKSIQKVCTKIYI